jgi:hypothetical protein
MQQKLYWNDRNRIPTHDPVGLFERAFIEYDWYFWALSFIAVAWMLTLIVGRDLFVAFLPIPGQSIKRLFLKVR